MRILADEDFPLPAVMRLRELGHDVMTASEAGIANDETPDAAVIGLANQLERAIITHNRRDFRRFHREHPEHGGVDSLHARSGLFATGKSCTRSDC
jgi:hypothetical protein